MATEKKYLSHAGLEEYDRLLKAKIATDNASTLNSAKSYTDTEIAKITNGDTKVSEATHADIADNLSSARTISLTGDATGSVSFDGSKDVSITVTVADNSHNHTIGNVDGLQDVLDSKADASHDHSDIYYSKTEIDNMELITVEAIDSICNATITYARTMSF